MKHNYFALKASLPMLRFDEAPPVSSEKFLELCAAFLDPDRMKFLSALKLDGKEVPRLETGRMQVPPPVSEDDPGMEAVAGYMRWEICLRNTLALLRAGKLSVDPEPYLVKFAPYDSTASATAAEVFSSPGDPMEKERMLNAARWRLLDGMEWKHTFDFDGLCIYRIKLLILEKIAARKSPDAAGNLDKAAEAAERSVQSTDNQIISSKQE